jgi:MFS transporter, PPP family, 3-phenylpropionic acid transporter
MSAAPETARRPRPGVAIHGLFLVFGVSVAAFFPFQAAWLDEHGFKADEIGLVIAVMAATRTVFLPIWGHLADTRTGRRTALQVGALMTGVCALVLGLLHVPLAIIVTFVILSMFMVAVGPNVDSMALTHLGESNRSEYGNIRGWESFSYAVACLVVGTILQSLGSFEMAMAMFGVSMLAVFAWAFTMPRDAPERHEDDGGKLGAIGAVFREAPRFWLFLLALFLLWIGFNAAWSFFTLKIVDAGGGPLLIGVGAAIGGAVEFPVMRLSARLHHTWGIRNTYMLGCAVYVVGFILWGAIDDPQIVAFLTFFEGIGFGFLFTTGVVVIGTMLPSSLYSSGNSVAGVVGWGIAPIIGAGLGGIVYRQLGPFVLYMGAAALVVGAAAVAWFALSPPELSQPVRSTELQAPGEPDERPSPDLS